MREIMMINLFWTRTLLMFLIGLTCACSKVPELTKVEGFAQGTTYHLTFELPQKVDVTLVKQAVSAELERIDTALSNYRPDSAIELFNAQKTTETLTVSTELSFLVEEARKVHRASGGCYDLTIKPLFDAWGFKKDQFTPPTAEALAQILLNVGLDKLITIDPNHLRKQVPELRIDISSIGQGYSVGQITKILEQFGIRNYLVEIGGELVTRGQKPNGEPWRIAIEKPLANQRKVHKIVSFNGGAPMALMASGTYRHYFDDGGKRYSHILDARNGMPVEHDTLGVTVLHPDPTLADAWSTALLCLGSHEGLKVANENSIAALFIDQQGDKLVEAESAALKALKTVSFIQPN